MSDRSATILSVCALALCGAILFSAGVSVARIVAGYAQIERMNDLVERLKN